MKALDDALLTLKTKAEPLLARYRELQPREQVMVTIGAVVVAITLVYLVLWEPPANARTRQATALADERALAERPRPAHPLARRRAVRDAKLPKAA